MVIKCPKCNKLLEVPKEKLGKKEVCEHCENVFVVDESLIYKEAKIESEPASRTVEHKIVEAKIAAPGETTFYSDEHGADNKHSCDFWSDNLCHE